MVVKDKQHRNENSFTLLKFNFQNYFRNLFQIRYTLISNEILTKMCLNVV